ncbi:MAG: DUF6285 domain-containing protein [Myxococcota bacterium]
MQDRPTASELLSAIADLLEKQVLGATQGSLRHPVRVAGNLCRILEREAENGGTLDRREVRLLADVLGESPAGRDALDLTTALAERLDAGGDRALEKRAHAALVEIVRGKLQVAKPGHDAYDFSPELD